MVVYHVHYRLLESALRISQYCKHLQSRLVCGNLFGEVKHISICYHYYHNHKETFALTGEGHLRVVMMVEVEQQLKVNARAAG